MLICLKIFHFFLHLLSFISKLNAGSILKVEVASPKSKAILVAINKRNNANSNEASWASQCDAAQVLLHV